MKRLLIFVILLIGVGAASLAGVAWWIDQSMRQSVDPQGEPIVIVIESGSSLHRVARLLDEAGVLDSRDAFVWYTRYRGLAQEIKAGEYEIPPGITGLQVLEKLVAGEVFLHTVTLVEGWTYREALLALQAHPAIRVTQEVDDPAATMAALGRSDLHPEGRFFPDTYRFERDTSDLQLLGVALERMDVELRLDGYAPQPAQLVPDGVARYVQLEAARALGQRGYRVTLAEASTELGGRVLAESRLPGLAEWLRVHDWRAHELDKLPNVEIYRGSALTAPDILEYGFEHLAIATGGSPKEIEKAEKDLAKAEEVLEEDHYGLEKVKERILEYLAVQQRMKKMKGPCRGTYILVLELFYLAQTFGKKMFYDGTLKALRKAGAYRTTVY